MKTQVTIRPLDSILSDTDAFLSASEYELLARKPAANQSDWLAGRYVLKKFFHDSCHLQVPLSEIEVLYKDKRPIITYGNETWSASISHSHEYIAVSFAKDARPGIDIERLTSRRQSLQQYIMNDSEEELLENVGYEAITLWTMKEAVFKADPCQIELPDYKLIDQLNDSVYVILNTQTDVLFEVTTSYVANYVVSYTLYPS